ncbi:unnamed protein product [Rotaria sordida]|uniref:Phosphatidic acid phosphatase type 2/haloperoxidase domain-containing protein n=1 Tax=Rotaria sordida TaxID=392033 RepID=A0A814N7T6_9BILA|nr:unnamed protein product [Rotaria sordida]CAF3701279.1 unnamed protein product [Rotaria sordida]
MKQQQPSGGPYNNQHPSQITANSTESVAIADHYDHIESIWRIVLDIISLTILTVITVISHYVATPFTRGFFCTDTAIKYPYKDNTIPTYAAVILSIALPVIWMWTTEFCKVCYYGQYPRTPFRICLELCGGKKIVIKPIIRNLYILTVIFAYGYLATWVLTEIAKNFVGELRPHFLAVCQPSPDCSTLISSYQFYSYLQYGSGYTCQNTDDASVREARRSFFSGHTAPLFFGFTWLIMYIHISWSWRHLGLLGHLFQIGIAILGCYIGYSRISDFHHHWQDVFFGSIVGSLIAFATFKFILNWRHYTPGFLPHIVAINQRQLTGKQNRGRSVNPIYRDVAESDSDIVLGSEQQPELVPLYRCRKSSNEAVQKMNNNSLRREKYDDNSVESKRLQPPDVAIRSNQKILRPISLLKIVFDGLALIIVLAAWLIFKYFVKPVRRAFLCSDLNLYHPPPEKKVFPTWLLFICAIIIPLVIILLSESIRWFYLHRRKAAKVVYELQIRSKVFKIPEWVGNLYIIVGVFLFANCANSLLTNIGKVAVGRLRPHFIPSCFDKFSYTEFCRYPNEWMVNYVCLGEASDIIKEKDGSYDIRQSFPSGHASSAFCGLIFLALYVHKVWNYRNFGLFPYLMKMGCFALAAYIGITRITDNRHHATDVLSGAILGTVVAFIGFRYMVNSFKQSVLRDLGSESSTY